MPVSVERFDEVRRAIRKIAPDIYKQMNKEIAVALKSVVNDARTHVPDGIAGLYNWNEKERKSRTGKTRAFPQYNASVIRRGLTYSLAGGKISDSGFKAFYHLLNKSAAGAIMETAGAVSGFRTSARSQSNNPNAGAYFNMQVNNTVGSLEKVGKHTGRLMAAAYKRNQGKALDQTMAAINKAADLFNNRVSKSGKAA